MRWFSAHLLHLPFTNLHLLLHHHSQNLHKFPQPSHLLPNLVKLFSPTLDLTVPYFFLPPISFSQPLYSAQTSNKSIFNIFSISFYYHLPSKYKTFSAEKRMEFCGMERLKTQPLWVLALFAVGSLSVLKFIFVILKWFYVNFLRPGKNLRKYGSWAMVTGPTDGIGKGFAFQLARKGINLVLVGRNPDKLKEVSESILSKYSKVQIKTVVVDFSGDIDAGVVKIKDTIEGLDVGVLINNVGVSYPYARFFHEVDEELLKNLIKVNVEGTTKVTQAVLPSMLKRKKGAIVNIGSGAAIIIPSDPLYAVYAGTKAYIDQFSRCLYVEYKKSGIDVQCQVPLYVATKMASVRKSSFFIPSTDGYARAGLRWIGYEPRCTPYWPHQLLWGLLYLLPESLIDSYRLKFNMGIRKRGQLKDARKKE